MVDYSGALLKIERAKAHIAEAQREIASFLGSHPYRVIQELNFEIEQFAMLVSLTKPVPASLAAVIGDAVHNLRTALDHAICATVADQGKTIRDTTFPFAKSEADLSEVMKWKARKASETVKALCRDVKPYPGGNDLLVALHELDLLDKHQLVLALAAAGEFNQRYIEREGKPELRISSRVHYLGAETEIIPLPEGRESEVPFEIGISVNVVLGPNTPLAGQPCVAALNALMKSVEDVVSLFHKICP